MQPETIAMNNSDIGQTQRGASLIEIILGLALLGMISAAAFSFTSDYMSGMRDEAAAEQMQVVVSAYDAFFRREIDRYLGANPTVTTFPETVTITNLEAAGYLPAAIAYTNATGTLTELISPHRHTYTAYVNLDVTATPRIDVLIMTTETNASDLLSPEQAGAIAAQVGGLAGFTSNQNLDPTQPVIATGAYGSWVLDAAGLASFGLNNVPAGRLVALLTYDETTATNDYLSRVNDPDRPEVTRMATNMMLGGHDIRRTNDLNVVTANAERAINLSKQGFEIASTGPVNALLQNTLSFTDTSGPTNQTDLDDQDLKVVNDLYQGQYLNTARNSGRLAMNVPTAFEQTANFRGSGRSLSVQDYAQLKQAIVKGKVNSLDRITSEGGFHFVNQDKWVSEGQSCSADQLGALAWSWETYVSGRNYRCHYQASRPPGCTGSEDPNIRPECFPPATFGVSAKRPILLNCVVKTDPATGAPTGSYAWGRVMVEMGFAWCGGQGHLAYCPPDAIRLGCSGGRDYWDNGNEEDTDYYSTYAIEPNGCRTDANTAQSVRYTIAHCMRTM